MREGKETKNATGPRPSGVFLTAILAFYSAIITAL